MKQFIKVNFWQILATVLAVGAILAGYHTFILGRPQKELQIIVKPLVSLVDIRPEVVPDIKISYSRTITEVVRGSNRNRTFSTHNGHT